MALLPPVSQPPGNLPHTSAYQVAHKDGQEILHLAWRCHDLLEAMPEKHHPDWPKTMKKLWQLDGLDEEDQNGSLTLFFTTAIYNSQR